MHTAVKEIEKSTPLVKNGRLILLCRQLIVDILKLQCLRVVTVIHTADPVREHSLKRDGLLRRPWDPVVSSGLSYNLTHLRAFFLRQMGRHFDFLRISFSHEYSFQNF